MKKYNHLVDVAFSVVSKEEDPERLTKADLLVGMLERLMHLHKNWDPEAFGFSDTYIVDEEDPVDQKLKEHVEEWHKPQE